MRNIQQEQQESQEQYEEVKLYESHIPTSNLQKILLFTGSSIAALVDPWRHDMVAVSGETGGIWAIENLLNKMNNSEEGKEILQDQPIINTQTIPFDELLSKPRNTFGFHYSNFMKQNQISPDTRDPVKFIDDPELAYVIRRYRETHDLVHSLLNMKTNMLGEVTVKWVEAIQTNLPMTWGAAILGATRLAPRQRRNYVSRNLPWALKCGYESKLLMNVYFEKRWDQDLNDLRRELNIPKVIEE